MRKLFLSIVLSAISIGVVHADVRTQEKSQVTFTGGLGRLVNIFGGRGARDGVVTTVALKGNRMLRTTGDVGQLIDLGEEKIYEINFKDKSYSSMTFAELRQKMQEAAQKAQQQAAANTDAQAKPNQQAQQPNVDIDFDVKETGQRKMINGFDTREVVMTIGVHEKGKTLDQAGGLVMTSSNWLTGNVAAYKEEADFERKFAEKIGLPTIVDAQQMAMASAMYPMLRDAMKKMQTESVNLSGTPVMQTTTVEAVADPSQTQQQQQAQAQPKEQPKLPGLGGLAGRLGRKIANKDDQPAAAAPAASAPNRSTFMTLQHELLKVDTTATDADVQIPAGFKQKPS
jgi:hypothetical protein